MIESLAVAFVTEKKIIIERIWDGKNSPKYTMHTIFFVVYITKSQFFVGTKDEELKAEEKKVYDDDRINNKKETGKWWGFHTEYILNERRMA